MLTLSIPALFFAYSDDSRGTKTANRIRQLAATQQVAAISGGGNASLADGDRGESSPPAAPPSSYGGAAQVREESQDGEARKEGGDIDGQKAGNSTLPEKGMEMGTNGGGAATETRAHPDGQTLMMGQHWKESRDPTSIFHFTPVPPGGNASMTPRLLHLMWISPYLRDPYVVPPDLIENAQNWQRMNPKWKVTLWTNTLVREHLPDLVSKILFNISSPAWISDLSRYSILELYGGVYLDADTWPVHPMDDIITKYSPFTVCQGYDDVNGSIALPFKDIDMCRRLANGLIATPPGTRTMQQMIQKSFDRSMSFGKNGTAKFHLGFTGPYVWKTTVRHDPSWSILSQKTFMPCGFRNPAKQGLRVCNVQAFKDDPQVIGMHKLTWTR